MVLESGRSHCFGTSIPVILGLPGPSAGVAWLSDRDLVTGELNALSRFRVGPHGVRAQGYTTAGGGLVGLTLSPDRRHVALALWERDGVHVVTAAPPPSSGETDLRIEQRLLLVPGGGPGVRLQWR